jgi:transcription initiation factor TFIIIB Brf1 subunit/transcription initiation factor TFIIB
MDVDLSEVPFTTALDYIEEFAERVALDADQQTLATSIGRATGLHTDLSGRSPRTIAASCVYLAALVTRGDVETSSVTRWRNSSWAYTGEGEGWWTGSDAESDIKADAMNAAVNAVRRHIATELPAIADDYDIQAPTGGGDQPFENLAIWNDTLRDAVNDHPELREFIGREFDDYYRLRQPGYRTREPTEDETVEYQIVSNDSDVTQDDIASVADVSCVSIKNNYRRVAAAYLTTIDSEDGTSPHSRPVVENLRTVAQAR